MKDKIEVINEIGAFRAKLSSIKTKESKGKTATWLEFKHEDGRVCATRLGSPMQSWDHYTLAEIVAALKREPVNGSAFKGKNDMSLLTATEKYIGEELIIYVRPIKYDGGVFWTVKQADSIEFWPKTREKTDERQERSNDNSDPFGASAGSDDIPF